MKSFCITAVGLMGMLSTFSGQAETPFLIERMIPSVWDWSRIAKPPFDTAVQKTNMDFPSLISLLRLEAEKGTPFAQGFLGHLLVEGKGMSKNHDQGMELLRRSAENGMSLAMQELGFRYLQASEPERDYQKALRWLGLASEKGDPRAPCALGYCYQFGLGTPTNNNESFKLYKKSADLGDSFGCWGLAVCFSQGLGTQLDLTNALLWASKSAAQGIREAQLFVADAYRNGKGTAADASLAIEWYQRASTNDSPIADYELASMLTQPKTRYRNTILGNHFLLRAANAGHREAQLEYALANLRGDGIPTNYPEGLRWLQRSAEAGWPKSEWCLGRLYVEGMDYLPKSELDGLKWIRRAAEHGSNEAQRNMAMRLVRGNGLPRDPEEGIKYFRMAAEQGIPQAQNDLAYCMETELKDKADLVEVCKWYLLASRQGISRAKVNLSKLQPRLTPIQSEESRRRADSFTPNILKMDPLQAPPSLMSLHPIGQ